MTLTCQLGCPPMRCNRRAGPLSDGGWSCVWLAGLGALETSTRAATAPPASHGGRGGAEPASAAKVAAIEAGRCPCCGGGLGASDWPTWRRCVACTCHWKTAVIAGLKYSETVTNPRCTARSAAPAARRTA